MRLRSGRTTSATRVVRETFHDSPRAKSKSSRNLGADGNRVTSTTKRCQHSSQLPHGVRLRNGQWKAPRRASRLRMTGRRSGLLRLGFMRYDIQNLPFIVFVAVSEEVADGE